MAVHIMKDGFLGGNIKPKDLVFSKSVYHVCRVFVVLDFVPPNQLKCLTCENKIKTLYVNVRDNRVRTQDI